MIYNSTRILIIFSLCGILASSPERPIDCRKFVFAPLCRGVAAKRENPEGGQIPPAIYVNAKNFKELLKNLRPEMGFPRDYEEDRYGNYERERDEGGYKFLEETSKKD